MQRWLLVLAYDGSDFHGWQWQPSVASIEDLVQKAVAKVANHPLKLTVCGRTDSGVHAVAQCVHFDSDAERLPDQWLQGINTHLPSCVRVHRVQAVDDDFHARFSATSRLYRYCIETGSAPSPTLKNGVWHLKGTLDAALMQKAAKSCLGEHDFSAFRGPDCQSPTPMRRLMRWQVDQLSPSFYVVSVQANAFLHHMVRLMVGALVQVGQGRQVHTWPKTLLDSKRKPPNLVMAPACGLYFWQATYNDDSLLKDATAPKGGWCSMIEQLLQG